MPVTEAIKPSAGGRRKTTENTVENLSKNRSGRIKESSDEIQSRGDDLTSPVIGNKKLAPKRGVTDNSEKKPKPLLSDKVPKKTVQRAKGSMALNKTIDPEDKKKVLNDVEGMNRNSTTVIKDNADNVKVKAARSKLRQSVKSNRPGSEKRVSSGKAKNWSTVVKKKSETTVATEEEIVDVEPPVTKTEEIQRENVPLSSCSFFEKLQQGVRAYFGSRNSLMDEKSKKKVTEGGIRTGARVANEGKEETKARIQDNKIINKIKYSDIHLFYDRPRLKSNSGGQTNNFLYKKPKILPYVKRKKLYHPKNKNNCVRIQIPRKGYFCRSFEFRPNQSTSLPWKRRMESTSLPTKPEIQIARMASAGSKGSDIHKKGIEQSRKETSGAERNGEECTLAQNYLETLNFILNNQMIAQEFENEVNRMALNWPAEGFLSPEDVNSLSNKEKIMSGELEFDRDEQLCAASEKLSNTFNSATYIQKQDDCIQIESSDSYAFLEAQIRNSISSFKTPEHSKYIPDPSFDILMQCLRDSLGEEQPYSALGISSLKKTNGSIESNFITETYPEMESVIKPKSGKIDKNMFNEYESPLKMEKSEEKFAKLLIGDIDLHSELQNYLKKTKKNSKHDSESVSIPNQNDESFGSNERDSFSSKGNFDLTPDPNQVQHTKSHRNSEIKSSSEEALKVRTNQSQISVRTNQSQISVRTNQSQISVRTKSSENLTSSTKNGLRQIDSKELLQKTSRIKAAHKTTPSPLSHTNANEKLVSYLLSLLFKKHKEQFTNMLDCYEKVFPMRTKVGTEKKTNKVLHSISMESIFTESSPSKIRNTKSESNTFQRLRDTDGDKKLKTEKDDVVNPSQGGKKWCPTLDELVDIYGCILKQSSKKKSSKMTRNSWFSSIMSTIKDKLNEKQNKVDLINFTKTLRDCFKPPSDWTPGTDSNRQKKLQEYVNMFQEILLSSLSIEQISYLNGVISQLQEEGKEALPEVSEVQNIQDAKSCKSNDRIESESKTTNSVSPASRPENTKTKDPTSKENTSASVESKNRLSKKSSKKKINPIKKPVKVALSTPTALEKVLKSTFNSENVRKKTNATDKILVNVKLCGSQVLVNDFSFIRNERLLKTTSPTRNKVSELIIENITSDKVSKTSLKDLNPSPPAPEKNSKKSIKTNRNIKIIVKSTKLKHQRSRKKLKTRSEGLDNPDTENNVDRLKPLTPAQKSESVTSVEAMPRNEHLPLMKSKKSFEYDQQQLKAQHPINAIIETSESKIMESMESLENIHPNKKSLAEAKTLKKPEAPEAKESFKNPAHNFFSKVLLSDLGWGNYGAPKDLVRTKSHNLNLNRAGNSILNKNSKNDVKFLDDLQFKSRNAGKKNRKVPTRQQNMYFCYPSLVLKEESIKKNKKAKEPDLKPIKTTGSKALKKADLRVVQKTSSKAIKKTDLKGVKTSSSKGIKQVDSKGSGKTNSKVMRKKELKEGAKKSGKLPTLSSQVAASERLARRPERFCKPTRIPSKQKENTSHTKKGSANKTPHTKAPKLLEDTILYIKKTSDFSSESLSFNASTESSNHEGLTRQKQKSQTENANKLKPSSDAPDGVDKYKNVPVVIYSTSDDSDYVTSQFAIIRSDSILKTLSRSPISLNKINSVFKSHSDVKFYPGRIPDNAEEQQTPWITFILTPQQQANAELPDYQVKIVDKHNMAEEKPKFEDFENDQIPLNSIEKFIEELKESKLKIIRQQKQLERLKKGRKKLSSCAFVKQNIKWSSSELLKNLAESKCQKRKIKIDFLEESGRHEKNKSDKETVLAKVVVSILQFLLDQKDKEVELNQIGTSKGQESDDNSQSEKLQSDLNDGANGDVGEKWHVIEKTTSEMLNTVINKVLKSGRLVKKSKLILAIKDELEERGTSPEANVDGLLELSKKVEAIKSLEKLNIETSKNDFFDEAEEEKLFYPMPFKKEKTEESLLPTEEEEEEEVKSLERKPSIYFDAEEKVKEESEECANQSEYQSGEPFFKTLSEEPGESEAETKAKKDAHPKGLFSASDENLLPSKAISPKAEKTIFNEIYANLRKNNVFYSMVLFDTLLKKKVTSVKDEKMQSVLQTVNQKSQDLIAELEKNAWMKLDILLEEVLKLYNAQPQKESSAGSVYHCITYQLNRTLAFIGSIQTIKTKMAHLQNFMSQKNIRSDFDVNNIFSKFLTGLNQLKNTVIPKLTCSATGFFEDENFRKNSGYEIRPVKADHKFDTVDDLGKKSQIQDLKNQIKDQRLFIEFLINSGSGSPSSEINDIRNRVSEKIEALERSPFSDTKGESVRNPSLESLLARLSPLSQTSSILSLTKTCRNWGIIKRIRWNVKPWK